MGDVMGGSPTDRPVSSPEAAGRIMRIDTFASTTTRIPSHLRVAARIMTNGEYLPMVLHAPTIGEAEEKAQAFWDAELERAERRRMATIKRASARKKKAARTATPEDTQHVADVPPHKEKSND